MLSDCVFCRIVRDELLPGDHVPAMVAAWDNVVAFIPINPVVTGHVLVVPKRHVTDTLENPALASVVMERAAQLARTLPGNSWDIITSVGKPATQTVFHLYIHLIPRRDGDGLKLPWSTL